MKFGFYHRLARNNVHKNYRFYIPQILTGTGLTAGFYIVSTLSTDRHLSQMPGGSVLPFFMSLGTGVLALLSLILVLYTNSFLMKQRRREYGLYNVLGMEKRHISRVLFHETMISASCSILCGLALGLLFYKLCALLICRLFKSEIVTGFDFIRMNSIAMTVLFFAALYAFAYLLSCISIRRLKPVELLQSTKIGEREPKVKWPILVLGIITLIAGYGISIIVNAPVAVIFMFFPAVVLVIIGTYCLFTVGSIFVLKQLKKNSAYYYRKDHMFSVSGLLYRMKQNAVGLASIAVLATGVLIMVSSTVSLYTGMQDVLTEQYPQDLYVYASYETSDGTAQEIPNEAIMDMIRTVAEETGNEIEQITQLQYLEVSYLRQENTLLGPNETDITYSLTDVGTYIFITQSEYAKMTGIEPGLHGHDIAVCKVFHRTKNEYVPTDYLMIHGTKWTITGTVDSFPIRSQTSIDQYSPQYGIIVADDAALGEIFEGQKRSFGVNASPMTDYVTATFADRQQLFETGNHFDDRLFAQMEAYAVRESGQSDICLSVMDESVWSARESLLGMYGSFLFLGIILGVVCMFATVLIIYYKQISEGYEDRESFRIMKKVGMSDPEIRASIRSQTRLVFFLPPVAAMIHTAFAFPMINRMLHVLMLSATRVYVICTLITCVLFTLLYYLIYHMTAKTYYKIVHE